MLHGILKKLYFQSTCQSSEKKVHSYAINYWLVSLCSATERIRPWFCKGVVEAQAALTAVSRSSAMLGLVSLRFLLTILCRFSMAFRSGKFRSTENRNTKIIKSAFAVWTGAKSCRKMISATP